MSLVPASLRLTIWKGSTFRKRLTLLEGDITSDAEDLTDFTAVLEVAASQGGATIYTLSTDNDRITITPLEGEIELILTAEETEALTWTSGYYNLKITESGGDTDTLLYGPIVVRNL